MPPLAIPDAPPTIALLLKFFVPLQKLAALVASAARTLALDKPDFDVEVHQDAGPGCRARVQGSKAGRIQGLSRQVRLDGSASDSSSML